MLKIKISYLIKIKFHFKYEYETPNLPDFFYFKRKLLFSLMMHHEFALF